MNNLRVDVYRRVRSVEPGFKGLHSKVDSFYCKLEDLEQRTIQYSLNSRGSKIRMDQYVEFEVYEKELPVLYARPTGEFTLGWGF